MTVPSIMCWAGFVRRTAAASDRGCGALAAQAVESRWVRQGVEACMNQFNAGKDQK